MAISGAWSKWRIWDAASRAVAAAVVLQQKCLSACAGHAPVAAVGLGFALDHVAKHLSPFGLFCPIR